MAVKCFLAHGFVIYRFHSKLACLSKLVKVTDSTKDNSLRPFPVNYESVIFILQAPDNHLNKQANAYSKKHPH